jgi:hypothetical protein
MNTSGRLCPLLPPLIAVEARPKPATLGLALPLVSAPVTMMKAVDSAMLIEGITQHLKERR